MPTKIYVLFVLDKKTGNYNPTSAHAGFQNPKSKLIELLVELDSNKESFRIDEFDANKFPGFIKSYFNSDEFLEGNSQNEPI